jgi:hypothetical protein
LDGAAVAALPHYTSVLEAEMENKQKQSSRNTLSRNNLSRIDLSDPS